jgi:hypothetical protein
MKIGYGEPVFLFVKKSKSPVEENVFADSNLA